MAVPLTPEQRRTRRRIVMEWLQLADDAERLADEIRAAPPGTFTDAERQEALFELEQTVWTALTNPRPRLPPATRKAPVRARTSG
jgi:hypothetical protein